MLSARDRWGSTPDRQYDRTVPLPNFLIIGAMKAGTTALADALGRHPDVFMCDPKEPNFFCESRKTWRKGLGWYEGLFRDVTTETAIGEASTWYSREPHHSGVVEKVADTLPQVRIVYLVRHPVDRIRSMYAEQVSLDREDLQIDEAVRVRPEYVDYSRYAFQIERWLERFERERILVVSAAALRDDEEETMGSILDFLEVPNSELPRVQTLNARAEKVRPSAFYRPLASVGRLARVDRVLPLRYKVAARRAFGRPIGSEASELDADTVAWLWEQLAADHHELVRLAPEAVTWQLGSLTERC